MRMAVRHVTTFGFEEPTRYAIHDVRLTPQPADGQRVASWRIQSPGKRADWSDGFGNVVTTFTDIRPQREIVVVAEGVYEWDERSSWLRYPMDEPMPPTFWLRNQGLARHDATFDGLIADLAPRAADDGARVPLLHELARRIAGRVAYRAGASDVTTTAAAALAAGAGVCQDHAHVFIAACRRLGIPARYASGYLRTDDPRLQIGRASHAWAETWVPNLGWVGFDPANGASPAGGYLRLAVGLDYADAAPVTGRRVGGGVAKMDVTVTVEEAG